jgi:hypothetical protein
MMHTATAPKSFVRLVFISLVSRLITIQYEISGLAAKKKSPHTLGALSDEYIFHR